MKKFLAALLVGTAVFSASAQTEFRNLSFDEGLAAAKQEGKLVFIDFFTTWCGPCKMMSSKTFPEKAVGDYMNAKFIPMKMDAEKEGLELARKYGVNAYPTYIILDTTGKQVAKVTGYMDGQRFINELDAALDPEQSPERIAARYQAGERTPKIVNAYAMQFMKKGNEDEGFKVVNDYFASLSDADRLKPENAFLFTTYTTNLESELSQYMVANQTKFPAETRQAIDHRLGNLYNSRLNTYTSGYMFREGKYKADEFAQLKEARANLGITKEGDELVYEFIEKRPTCTDAEYFAFINDNYSRLDPPTKDMIIINLTRLVTPDTPELKAAMAKFLRANLSEMSSIGIQFSGRTLQNLEQ